MPSRIDRFFSEADREAIRAATTEAERHTSGELVVYVVERCDPHSEAAYKGALIGGAVGAVVGAFAVHLFGGWGTPDQGWLLLALQLGVLAGWLLSRVDGAARLLVGEEALTSRVEGRAAGAFVEEQVFATAGRSGVLIFVALFEHRVLVVADEGVRDTVGEAAWDGVATRLSAGIRAGRPAAAIVEAVKGCAELLRPHAASRTNVDEISNEPRFRGA